MEKITDQLEQIKEDMCDRYCKYTDVINSKERFSDDTYDEIIDRLCDKCPLNFI